MAHNTSCLLPIPAPPPKEGTRFKRPPLDGSLTIPQLYDWHLTHNADHPVFMYNQTGDRKTVRLTYSKVVPAFHRVGNLVLAAKDSDTGPVAIVAASDTITYFCTIVGMLRAGICVVPISLSNSANAAAHLLSETAATHILVSDDLLSRNLVASATALLPGDEARGVLKMIPMPTFKDIFLSEPNCNDTFLPDRDYDYFSPAIYVHSSGSSSLPKPIPWTHASLLQVAAAQCLGWHDLRDESIGLYGISMSHASGLNHIAFLCSGGYTAAAFSPDAPYAALSPEIIAKAFLECPPSFIFCMPSYLEAWSKDPIAVNFLKGLKAVGYGGGPLSKPVGDALVAEGVPVCTLYGSTEAGVIGNFFPEVLHEDWEYLRINPHCAAEFIATGDGVYELVVVKTPTQELPVVNSVFNGKEAYSTNGYWRIVGRIDDQITLSNGLKTNPRPIETFLSEDPRIQAALVFGRAHSHIGVIIFPVTKDMVDTDDEKSASHFRDCIWPLVEQSNAIAPRHSHIFKEMIIIALPSKPLLLSGKGSIQRGMTLDQYKDDIDTVYRQFGVATQAQVPLTWTYPNTLTYVRFVVQYVLPVATSDSQDLLESAYSLHAVPDDADLFERGLDSLQATWIRNSILHALRDSQPHVIRSISSTFVYDYPSISRLAGFLCNAISCDSAKANKKKEIKLKAMHALIDKYTQSFPMFRGGKTKTKAHPDGAVVLLTGSTGSLGSNILSKLIKNGGVKCVYTMSRPSSDGMSAKERHVKTFEREGLKVMLLDNEKVFFLEGNAAHADFGIDKQFLLDMQSSVTHIIHNGWRVNLNVAVSSFQSNICGVRNLIDFSLGGSRQMPARIIFISSIGVFQGSRERQIGAEMHIANPESAIGTGYSESKWISEQILERASKATPLPSTIVRCGQLTGGPSGAWNEHEWFPSLLKSSITLGKIPDAEGVVTWISAYDAAGAVVDMLDAKEEVLHIVNPNPVTWSSIISTFSKHLGIPTVPYAEWLASLEEAAKHVPLYFDAAAIERTNRLNPALRLLTFFRGVTTSSPDETVEALGFTRMSCERSTAISPSLQNSNILGEDDVTRWVVCWRKSGFLGL